MDLMSKMNKLKGWFIRNKAVLMILAVGIVLMVIPIGKKDDAIAEEKSFQVPEETYGITAAELEGVLSRIRGAGDVEVLLTCASGEKKIYQFDEQTVTSEDSESYDRKTVIVSNGSRDEEALIVQTCAPEYLGAVVVCQGADDPVVRLALSEAVSKATGLKSNQISIVKMK